MIQESDNSLATAKAAARPFRRAVLRGLAVISPPLFTILIFAWVLTTTQHYVLQPVTHGVRAALVWSLSDIESNLSPTDPGGRRAVRGQQTYYALDNGQFVPLNVFERVQEASNDKSGIETSKLTGQAVYEAYVDVTYLRPYVAIPFFLSLFILLLYLLGKSMAAGMGRFFWHRFEQIVHRLPLVRNVYGSVKQVSDFLFSEREIEYTRVVAVEYPRKGVWSLGFVTGESMLDIRSAANEPVLSLLVPTSPMPVTGVTVTVLKSETIDLNVTIDQAFQFIISCGVVVPPQQLQRLASPAAAPPRLAGAGEIAQSVAARQ